MQRGFYTRPPPPLLVAYRLSIIVEALEQLQRIDTYTYSRRSSISAPCHVSRSS